MRLQALRIVILSCTLLIAFPLRSSLSRSSTGQLDAAVDEVRPKGIVSRRLLEQLRMNPEEKVAAWVFFDQRDRSTIFRATEAAILRRAARGLSSRDETDIPVSCDYLQRLRDAGIRIRHVSRYLNAASVELDFEKLCALVREPFVESVDMVAKGTYPLPFSLRGGSYTVPNLESQDTAADPYGESRCQLEQIGAIPLLERGFDGSGSVGGAVPIRIAVLDSGFRLDHKAFAELFVEAQWDFVQGDPTTSNEPGDAPLQDRHGTAVLGVIAGKVYGEHCGPACGAIYLLAKTEIIDREVNAEEDNWIAGLEWADSAGADIVTSSLGYFDWYSREDLDGKTALCTRAAEIAISHGIVVVNAAGNRGFSGLVAPADGEHVLAIGAVDCSGNILYFSSRGPTIDGRIKPDFVALGYNVHSVAYDDTARFDRYTGTSLSTPLVAGICAQLLDMHREWKVDDLSKTLRATSSRSSLPDNEYGYGIPDAELAAFYSAPRYAGISPFPNPFSTEVRIQVKSFALSSSLSPVSIRVYDCNGALVRTLAFGVPRLEEFIVTWDGRNDSGRRVSAGIYFVAVEWAGLASCAKIVLLK